MCQEELCDILWEERFCSTVMNLQYIAALFSFLSTHGITQLEKEKESFKEATLPGFLIRSN